MKKLLLLIPFLILSCLAGAQTAASLFWTSDSLQVSEIVSETGDQFMKVGHHGPAVENSHMGLRIHFNDSGAVDVYSKSGRGMELRRYLWYPSAKMQETAGAGVCGYVVGETLGLGGIALWDGEKEVRLVATKGRTARAGDTKRGSFIEMISYGVPYGDDLVDISVRIDVTAKSREAKLTAKELSGKKVRFLSGVNFHDGQKVTVAEDYISVWGRHPANEAALPIGAGLFFSGKDFPMVEKTGNMVRIISEPAAEVKTSILSASSKEAELNNLKRFEAYMAK